MGVALDKAKAVRKGENLNETALQQYLVKNLGQEQGETNGTTIPFRFFEPDLFDTICRNRLCVASSSPLGANIKSGHDMGREYKILSALKGKL